MVKNKILILFIFLLNQKFTYSSNYLNNISFKDKENGLMVKFTFNNPMSPDSINAWQSKTDWFYFTFYNVSGDSAYLMNTTKVIDPLKSFQPIISEQSTQIGIKLKNRIETYEFFSIDNPNVINANLHYPLENFAALSSVANFKEKEIKLKNNVKNFKQSLLFLASGFTAIGLVKYENKLNAELKIGISIYVI